MTMPQPRNHRLKLMGIAVLLALLCATYLYRFTDVPMVRPDEAWESIAGYTLLQEHRIAYPCLDQDRHWNVALVQPRIVQTVVLSFVYKCCGMSIPSGRLTSLGVIFLACFVLYRALLLLPFCYRPVSFLGCVLFLADSTVFLSSRTIRPEAFLVLASAAAFYFVISYTYRTQRSTSLILAGVASGVGLYIHPNFLITVSSIIIVLLAHRAPRRALLVYGGSVFVGLIPYLLYLASLADQVDVADLLVRQLGLSSSKYNPLMQQQQTEANIVVATIQKELRRFVSFAKFPWRLVPAAAFFAVPVVALRLRSIRAFGLGLLAGTLTMFLLIVTDRASYLVIFVPLLVILHCGILQSAFSVDNRSVGRRNLLRIAAFGVVLLYAQHLLTIAGMLYKNRQCDFDSLLQEVHALVEPDAEDEVTRPIGPLVFWFAFHGKEYRSENETVETLAAFGPTHVIAPSGKSPCKCNSIAQYVTEHESELQLVGRTKDHHRYGSYDIFKRLGKDLPAARPAID
jgi:hypothetical protein